LKRLLEEASPQAVHAQGQKPILIASASRTIAMFGLLVLMGTVLGLWALFYGQGSENRVVICSAVPRHGPEPVSLRAALVIRNLVDVGRRTALTYVHRRCEEKHRHRHLRLSSQGRRRDDGGCCNQESCAEAHGPDRLRSVVAEISKGSLRDTQRSEKPRHSATASRIDSAKTPWPTMSYRTISLIGPSVQNFGFPRAGGGCGACPKAW